MSFWHGPPNPDATLAELREYIRPPKGTPRLLPEPPKPESKPEPDRFKQRFGLEPRQFLTLAANDTRWNATGQQAIDAALAGELADEDLEALGEAFFDENPEETQRLLKGDKNLKAPAHVAPKPGWWRELKLPAATSAGTEPTGSEPTRRKNTDLEDSE